jgi:putative FmdB family regulatory protein
MIYSYRCTECAYTFDLNRLMDERNNDAECELCKTVAKRYYTPITHSFNEGHGAVSSKPDSYWANAERVKQDNLAKKYNEQIEKSVYNDPTVNSKFKTIKEHVK